MLLYIMYSLPKDEGIKELPWPNRAMAGMFVRFGADPQSS